VKETGVTSSAPSEPSSIRPGSIDVTPAPPHIPYGRQSIDDADIDAVVQVLRGDWLTQGPAIAAFERALAQRVQAQFCVAFSSATAALHAAMAAAGIGHNHTVVTSPLSFAASANCARYVGAAPAFVDIDPTTLNLDLSAVGRCDALVAVHYAGLPVDLSQLRSRPRLVVEDAAHALGAVTPHGPVGNCAHSDLCVFSFHPVKAITTGEGGAITTNDARLAERLMAFRSHGMVRKPDEGAWYYEIESLGYNYRLTDLQAALGTSQLDRLGSFVSMRNALAHRYHQLLDGVDGVELPPVAPNGWTHAYHLFPVRVRDRRRVFDSMRAANIGVQVHYIPIYRHPIYADLHISPAEYPETERAYAGLLSLPMFPTLTKREQDRVVAVLIDAVDGC
jgi:UDP-4-amino-4,6-dideoxy-N-acetyl-beta-L-altrosamine transaminase